MGTVNIYSGSHVRLLSAFTLGCLLGARAAVAFPASDASSPSIETVAPAPTDSDLRHQLQTQSGFGTSAGGGWTFVPQVALDELFTDNVLNTETNRRWDLLTLATPSITINGDTPRAQVRFDYGPQFLLAARTPQENNITQQLLGTGQFTLVPDEFYLDARAVAGSSATGSGFGALGLGVTTPTLGTQINGLGTAGLSKQNQVQTSSLSVSPYWLHRFGDVGTAKVGYQFNETSFSQTNSILPLFFPSGNNSQHTTTNEGLAQFETGDRFVPFRDLVSLDGLVSNGNAANSDSTQYVMLNRLGYIINRKLSVYGELGYENLRFSGVPSIQISDAVWAVGTTYEPNPDSKITASFGHRDGQTAVGLNASYALSARTRISARYDTGLQNDLQTIASQLDATALDQTGQTVDSQTGAPVFIGTGGLGFQQGLFRTHAFTFSADTTLDRDQISVVLQLSQNTTIATVPADQVILFGVPAQPVGSTSQAATAFLTWIHQLSEVLTLNSGISYGTSRTSTSGTDQSLAAGIGMQYALNETLALRARYAYLNRISSTPGQSFYQNVLLVGISKQF